MIALITEQAENYAVRCALRAVLDVERSLGPWDVKVNVRGACDPIFMRYRGQTTVSFFVRDTMFSYVLDLRATNFRAAHLQALTPSNKNHRP